MTEKAKIRLNFEISEDLDRVLQQLAEETGESKSTVLRRAIILMEMALSAKKKGNKFGVANADNQFITEFVGL